MRLNDESSSVCHRTPHADRFNVGTPATSTPDGTARGRGGRPPRPPSSRPGPSACGPAAGSRASASRDSGGTSSCRNSVSKKSSTSSSVFLPCLRDQRRRVGARAEARVLGGGQRQGQVLAEQQRLAVQPGRAAVPALHRRRVEDVLAQLFQHRDQGGRADAALQAADDAQREIDRRLDPFAVRRRPRRTGSTTAPSSPGRRSRSRSCGTARPAARAAPPAAAPSR